MKPAISLAVFAVIAVIAWWTVSEDHDKSDKQPTAQNKKFIEYFIKDFEITAMNETGHPAYILQGERLEKLNRSNNTQITMPVLELLNQGGHSGQWKISADSALLNEKKQTVRLRKNVVMQQQNTSQAVTIRTNHLLINTDTQLASTRARVQITQGQSRLNSTGMVFDNISGKLEMTSEVKGFYLPDTRTSQ